MLSLNGLANFCDNSCHWYTDCHYQLPRKACTRWHLVKLYSGSQLLPLFLNTSSRAQLWFFLSDQWKSETKNRKTETTKENDIRYYYNFMLPPLTQIVSSHSSIGPVQVKLFSIITIHHNLEPLQMWWWASYISCPWLWGDGPCASPLPVLLHSCDIHSEELQDHISN